MFYMFYSWAFLRNVGVGVGGEVVAPHMWQTASDVLVRDGGGTTAARPEWSRLSLTGANVGLAFAQSHNTELRAKQMKYHHCFRGKQRPQNASEIKKGKGIPILEIISS